MGFFELLTNLLAGAVFLGVLWLALFLILPVASIAGTSKPEQARPWNRLFLVLLGFIPLWLVKGFGFVRSLFRGEVFESAYWADAWNFSFTLVGVGGALWSVMAWALYLVGLVILGVVGFFLLTGVHGASSKGERLLMFGVFAGVASLGYLWGSSGRQWLVSWFA